MENLSWVLKKGVAIGFLKITKNFPRKIENDFNYGGRKKKEMRTINKLAG